MSTYSVSATHKLLVDGIPVRFEPPRIIKGSPMTIRRLLVMHFTAGWSLESTIEWWRDPKAKGASAHIIIDRDGTIVQCRPFNQTAGHAGTTKTCMWKDRTTGITYKGINSCSLGIELCNAGHLKREYYPDQGMGDLNGKKIPYTELAHKNGGGVKKWEIYPEKQLDVAFDVAKTLVTRYNLDDVLGHDDVCVPKNRKDDPGPAFPLTKFRHELGFDYPI